MSGIESNIAGSILQAGLQQKTVSDVQDTEANRGINAAKEAAKRAEQRADDIVADDSEMTVNTDGGGGGQGRNFSESPVEEEAPPEVAEEDRRGITKDETGQYHVDIDA